MAIAIMALVIIVMVVMGMVGMVIVKTRRATVRAET